jgi:hypothetical protein
LKEAGRRSRKRKNRRSSTTATNRIPAVYNDSFTIHELIAAKEFVEIFGSPSKARGLLLACGPSSFLYF